MAEKQRWTVTYTKHIKQKRKVYHDGFLDFQVSSRKVKLYDETNGLLDSKILKKDEVVSSGETLTFQAYLVDVGDPEGEKKATSDLKAQPSDEGSNRKPFSMLRPNFKKTLVPYEEKKLKMENKMPAKNLSPSQKMIRVFKKREMQKYGTAQSSPLASKPTTTEKPQKYSCTEEHADSISKIGKLGKNVSSYKPLRDAKQILSILQKQNAGASVLDRFFDNLTETERLVSSTKELQDSDAPKNVEKEESNKDAGIRISPHTASSKGKCRESQNVQDIDIANSGQVFTASKGAKNDLKAHLKECPSFDLGI